MFKSLKLLAAGTMFALALMTLGWPGAAADGATKWRGSYAYIDGRPPVKFTLTLTTKGKAISGRIVEDATFGDGSSDHLVANVTGTAFGYEVSFSKTYDGTGGQAHTVVYRGTLDGDVMYGFWQIGGQDVGAWYASRSAK